MHSLPDDVNVKGLHTTQDINSTDGHYLRKWFQTNETTLKPAQMYTSASSVPQ